MTASRKTTGKKISVDRTPFCDPAYLRRIDPVWMPGPVKLRFWEDRANRRDYLLWSASRLGFGCFEDLYRLKLSLCYETCYGSGLRSYWGESAKEAVCDCFPEYDWKPWLFAMIDDGFWDSPANRRDYLTWLGERLGFGCLDDWYRITMYDFLRNEGTGLIHRYRVSPAAAVIDSLPRRDWCEWKFTRVPPGFWNLAKNRRRYLRWLGKELGYRRAKDWYRITVKDIASHHGSKLLHLYSSVYDLMREFMPRLDWDRVDSRRPLSIEQVLAWVDEHHARHGTWPTAKSGEIPDTGQIWERINRNLNGGFRGLPRGTSLAKLVKKHRSGMIGNPKPRLTENQILAWADAHFTAHGRWPPESAGAIPGTTEDWRNIADALRKGSRGLSGGSSLAQLLAKHRGARNPCALRPLTEKRILAWAEAYFKARGEWPTVRSGPIPQSPGDSWVIINKALRRGSRGLEGRSSLKQLLCKHGLTSKTSPK